MENTRAGIRTQTIPIIQILQILENQKGIQMGIQRVSLKSRAELILGGGRG